MANHHELANFIWQIAEEVMRYSKGVWSSRLRLYPEGFFEVWLHVPPTAEQHAIVNHTVAEASKLEGLRSEAEQTIRLLNERHIALITAVVAGKITVLEERQNA